MGIVSISKWFVMLFVPYSNPNNDVERLSALDYKKQFVKNKSTKHVLLLALDIRKFEIELYWKRASYFWTLIGATFAGYAAISVTETISTVDRQDLQVFLACLGFVLSYGWCCANKGSKLWQENWENHVDLLEDDSYGKLYKTILRRPKATRAWTREYFTEYFTGPSEYSVSRINQLISVFVVLCWVYLLYISLDLFQFEHQIRFRYVVLVMLSVVAYIAFNQLGRTSMGTHTPEAFVRDTRIKNKIVL